jgi:hypothetical protein
MSIINYVAYDVTGRIVKTGICPEEMMGLQTMGTPVGDRRHWRPGDPVCGQ